MGCPVDGLTRDPRPLTYAAHLDANEDGSYVATFPDFGVGVTQGDDREEALARAADLPETMVANYMAERWQLPDPSPTRGRPLCGRRRSSPPRPRCIGRSAKWGSTRLSWRVFSASHRKESNACSAFITRRAWSRSRRPTPCSGEG
jgi:predicted RNase H-like HicB family nuclease